MIETKTDVVDDLRCMALRGSRPSEMLRTIMAHHPSEMLTRDVFARYFREAFCFTEGEASPLHGWLPDGTGELKDVHIDYLMTRRIQKNKKVWECAPKGDPKGVRQGK